MVTSPVTVSVACFDREVWIRIEGRGNFQGSGAIKKFAQTMIILVATPQYVMRYGMPESPEDLRRFPAVVFVERGSAQPVDHRVGAKRKAHYPHRSL